jgi:hypothetical protein
MSDELREQIYNNMNLKETEELLEIWQTNDRVEWSDSTFDVIKELLIKRGVEIPEQDDPINEYGEELDEENYSFSDIELKIIDNENPPDFYDPFEVLTLRDNINKVSKAVVVIYIILGFVNLQGFRGLFLGAFPSVGEIPEILWGLFVTVITVGIEIAIVYFPLKALSNILRILMEMEFNSRKAKQ